VSVGAAVISRQDARCTHVLAILPVPCLCRDTSAVALHTHHRTFHITRMPLDFDGVPLVTAPVLEKKWSDMTEEERWITPGDWEIQKGQGPITLHSEECLAASDTGVAMLRRQLREQINLNPAVDSAP